MSIETTSKRIAVVGGGISGLAAAHRLLELGHTPVLFEKKGRLGGALWTLEQDGYQIEQGVDNFITTVPWGVELCKKLGLGETITPTDSRFRKTYVVRSGKLHPLPDGFLMFAPTRFLPLALTPLLGPLGKLRCAMEYFIPKSKSLEDESIAHFVRRRLGNEAFVRLVEPLVGAVYAGDVEKISIDATLSRFRAMEIENGSIIRAMRRSIAQRKKEGNTSTESGPRFSMFVTLRGGLQTLVDAILEKIGPENIRADTEVQSIEKREGEGGVTWHLQVPGRPEEVFDGVLLATPSYNTATLLEGTGIDAAKDAAALLANVHHSSSVVLTAAFDSEQIKAKLDGMGIVIPQAENSSLLAISLSSRKYPHRAPEGKTLLRVFAGGTFHPEIIDYDKEDASKKILADLSKLLKIEGQPHLTQLARWRANMPQYYVGHKPRMTTVVEKIASIEGLEVAGNTFSGVGIPDCINTANCAVERLVNPKP